MFVDTAKVKLQAGKGGDGAVSFRHEIYILRVAPMAATAAGAVRLSFAPTKTPIRCWIFVITPS